VQAKVAVDAPQEIESKGFKILHIVICGAEAARG
jgi:hypothetical protein